MLTMSQSQAAPRRTQDVLQHFLASLPLDREVVLVPHSNVGAYVPALADQRDVVAAVFVDAVLPPRAGQVDLAPPELLDALRPQADDYGVLPPWTAWWDEADVATLFPSDEVRRVVEQEQQRLPLAYFGESLPVPAGWDDRPCAYLAFGDTYAAERHDAAARGWPVMTLPGGHLHMLNDPEQVAAGVLELLSRLGIDWGRA